MILPVLLYDCTASRKLHDTKRSFEYDKSRKVANVLRIDCFWIPPSIVVVAEFLKWIAKVDDDLAVIVIKFN